MHANMGMNEGITVKRRKEERKVTEYTKEAIRTESESDIEREC